MNAARFCIGINQLLIAILPWPIDLPPSARAQLDRFLTYERPARSFQSQSKFA